MELRKKISFIHYSSIAAIVLMPISAILKYIFVTKRIGDDGFFAKGDVVPYIFSFIWFAVVLAFLVFGFTYRIKFGEYNPANSDSDGSDDDSINKVLTITSSTGYHSHPASRMIFSPNRFPAVIFANVLCGLLLVASIVNNISVYISAFKNSSIDTLESLPFNVLDIVVLVVSAITALYFFYMAFKKSKFNSLSTQISSLIPPIWAVFNIISLFFKMNDHSNIFPMVFQFLAISFIALFLITESKFTLKNPAYYSVSKYVAFAEAAIIFGSASYISNAILSLKSSAEFDSVTAFSDLAFLGILTYIIIKLIKVNLYFHSHKRIYDAIK